MRYVTMKMSFIAEDDIFFPLNPVNTFRGAMGYSLKRISCNQRRNEDKYPCLTCRNNVSCAYAMCNETIKHSNIKGIDFLKNSSEIPHLMNITTSLSGNSEVKAGEKFDFTVRLYGAAVIHSPRLMVSAKAAAMRGFKKEKSRAMLESVFDACSEKIIWNFMNDSVKMPEIAYLHIPEPDFTNDEECEIMLNFISPVAFKDLKSDSITKEPEFYRIVGSLMRRYSVFEAIDGNKLDWHFKEISEMAKKVKISRMNIEPVNWERFSTRQQQRIPISGIVGSVSYIGPTAMFEELLNAGEILHCGKYATFGHGRIKVAQIRHLSNRDESKAFV